MVHMLLCAPISSTQTTVDGLFFDWKTKRRRETKSEWGKAAGEKTPWQKRRHRIGDENRALSNVSYIDVVRRRFLLHTFPVVNKIFRRKIRLDKIKIWMLSTGDDIEDHIENGKDDIRRPNDDHKMRFHENSNQNENTFLFSAKRIKRKRIRWFCDKSIRTECLCFVRMWRCLCPICRCQQWANA